MNKFTTNPVVIWNKVEGFPEYEISNTGLIKSIARFVCRTTSTGTTHLKTIRERLLKQHKRNGYLFVTLCKNGKSENKMIHHMVAAAFIGPRPKGLVVMHKDGNRENNHHSNLSYGSKARNTQDYYKSIGKRSGFVPYNHIPIIIQRINSGSEIIDIAKEYNVKRDDIAVINKIIALTGEELKIKMP